MSARILLGVSGGIAAYKALEFVRLATDSGHAVRVLQTPTSTRFVGEASFAALTGAPVLIDEFQDDPLRGAFPGEESPPHRPLSHLELVANADLFLIAPASANTLAKLAHGFADNLLTSCALAADCPVAVAPAMNNRMYEHRATQANLSLLRERGVCVIDPDVGRLASIGEHGIGRLPQPQRLLEQCELLLGGSASAWSGLRVLVTAGGTREPIDSVRFIGNSSSGRMGLALAQAAKLRGAEVTLVAANVALETPAGVRGLSVKTADELRSACEREFADCDILLMAAAVADFQPSERCDGKIKKHTLERLTIELEPTCDVLSGLAAGRRADQTLVGFAAEHGANAVEYARAKLSEKKVDAIVLNDISRTDIGFESTHNEVTIITPAALKSIEKASKETVAEAILDAVSELRAP